MELKKDSRWNAFDIVDFKSFKERMLPKIRFKNDVNETIKKSFIIIEKLLYHSYYEYEFYDIAAQKSLLYFEMALKIRFKEVNNVEWNKKKSLKELIDCFDSQHYFEVLNKEYLNWIRKVRNYYAHPDTYSFGGPMTKHNIENSVDLINDLYEDPRLRENRQLKLKDLQNKLDSLTKAGAVFVNYSNNEIISKADLIFIDNKGSSETIYLLFFLYLILLNPI